MTEFEKSEQEVEKLYKKTIGSESRRTTIRGMLMGAILCVIFSLASLLVTIPLIFIRNPAATGEGILAFVVMVPIGILGLILGGWLNRGSMRASMREFKKSSTKGDESIRHAIGARDPSDKEKQKIMDVLRTIADRGFADYPVHSSWFVIDSPFPNAYTLGDVLYLTSNAAKSEHLGAIIGHELGHLKNGDGRRLKALRLLVFAPIQAGLTGQSNLGKGAFFEEIKGVADAGNYYDLILKQSRGFLFSLISGGAGVNRYQTEWAKWFRTRDFFADEEAVKLGFKGEIIRYLESIENVVTASNFEQSWIQYPELRLDRLRD